jgi:hypothetical protein
VLWVAGRAYFRHRGTRVVTCPETDAPAAVGVDLLHAGVTTAIGEPELRIASCSGWPERQTCGQPCLSQIEAAPAECVVRTMLVDWYEGSHCAICGKAIGKIHWVEHKPALMTPGRETVEWNAVTPEELPRVLATHQRVCWTCHIANSARERLPGLVVEPAPETSVS